MSNRDKAIEALARHRENGADPSPADLARAEKDVDEIAIVLAHLMNAMLPAPADLLTQHQGGKIYKYPLAEIVDEEPE